METTGHGAVTVAARDSQGGGLQTLVFMPWCQIDRSYRFDRASLVLFERGKTILGLDEDKQHMVNSILATFENIRGEPVNAAAIVTADGDTPICMATEEVIDLISDYVVIACFSALANREYFSVLGRYCNSDCFSLYSQRLDGSNFVALVTRRREGRAIDTWPRERIRISMPVHCAQAREVVLDVALVAALEDYRSESDDTAWIRWMNALACFNQANSDSDNVMYQVEWVLLCSAFEHILGAKSKSSDVASKFAEVLVPHKEVSVQDAKRRSETWKYKGQSLRYEWMREFYRVRGDFAHGKLYSEQPAVWSPAEHLVLATIAFPLVVKKLLVRSNHYEVTDNDRVQIEVFERYADTPNFAASPPDQEHSSDTHWRRLLDDCGFDLAFDDAFERALEELGPQPWEED